MNIEKLFYKIDDLENEFNNNKDNSKVMSRVLHEFRIIHGSFMLGLQQKFKKCLDNNNNNVGNLINISTLSSLVCDIQKKINNLENILDCFLSKNCKNQNELNKLFKVDHNYKEYNDILKGITLFDTENNNYKMNEIEDDNEDNDDDLSEFENKINKIMENNDTQYNNKQNNNTNFSDFLNNNKQNNNKLNTNTDFSKLLNNNTQNNKNLNTNTLFKKHILNNNNKLFDNNDTSEIVYDKFLNYNIQKERFEDNFEESLEETVEETVEEYEEGYGKQNNELNNFGDKNVNNNNQVVDKQKNVVNNNTNSNNTFLYFYMPNCPHCENFGKTWNDIKSDKTYKNVNFVKLNINEKGNKGDKIRELMELYNVESFPTLILLNNNKVQHYPGSRTLNGIRNFINRNI